MRRMGNAPASGLVLAGRYRLIEPLGQGGMGSVWRAEHLALHSDVAVKIIDPRIAEIETGLSRFLREAQALAKLRSAHIVQVLDFGSEGSVVYLVMELLEGQSLRQRLEARGKLTPRATSAIIGEASVKIFIQKVFAREVEGGDEIVRHQLPELLFVTIGSGGQ